MQQQRKDHRHLPQQQHKPPNHTHFLQKVHAAFCQLSEPAQTVLIIGLLLLLAWLLTHPLLLVALLKAAFSLITIWVTLKQL